ncbi:acyl-CoA thioesterase [Pimelobacter simplex]|uniref:acyl-CoA thioesterase n=1 Tax=Nocardioides simplex TaxID=2045 RepID=UPI001933C2B6|nr:acyl-CoA thioesterase [Pimelobacter simplex]
MDECSRPSGVFRTRVEWIDTDASGIYHNSTVTRFVEAAEATLMRERGLGGYFASAPRVRFEADFLAPLFFGQEATATVSLAAIGTSSMTWEFEVWGEEFEGRARTRAARGRYVTVHMGTGQVAATAADGSRRSLPWPADWVAALTGNGPC